ncbi:MAG: FkbM family methyltransferase [Planctomycetes bacterium]|nr:FkbM family methyltransferase [Planctomycetota bacterium]
MKILVNLLCCFVPQKKWRKEIKRKLIGTKSRRKKLLSHGCKIENEVVITPEGVKIDISNVPHEAMGITKEVFLNKDYAINFSQDAVLIDIGLNRGIASLYFATYPNIIYIYSFEPFKPTFELAKRNLGLNPQLSEKIKAFNFGLGRKEITLKLPYMAKVTGGMSTTLDVCKGEKNTTEETVVIKDAAKEIAPIIKENKNKHIIVKCDCEGAEFEIFGRLNEEKLIGEIDVIIMEYHHNSPDELLGILKDNGFAIRTKILSKKMSTGYIYAVRMLKK